MNIEHWCKTTGRPFLFSDNTDLISIYYDEQENNWILLVNNILQGVFTWNVLRNRIKNIPAIKQYL